MLTSLTKMPKNHLKILIILVKYCISLNKIVILGDFGTEYVEKTDMAKEEGVWENANIG